MTDKRQMQRAFTAIFMLLASGCEPQPQPKLSDAVVQKIRQGEPGITEACLSELRKRGFDGPNIATDKCFQMTEPRRWRGLWRHDFEGSLFCPEPRLECSSVTPGDLVWLTFAKNLPATKLEPTGRLYSIDVIGRRTRHRASHGHFGMFDHELIVDRVISIREIEASSAPKA